MPLCPKCGKEIPPRASICAECFDECAKRPVEKQRGDFDKVLHVFGMACKSWLSGMLPLFVIGIIFATLGPIEQTRLFTLWDTLPPLLLIAAVAFHLARTDSEELTTAHVVLGSAIWPLVTLMAFLLSTITGGYEHSAQNAAFLWWFVFVTPASGMIGMLRGVRGRRAGYAGALVWCMLLISACCVSGWYLSHTPFRYVLAPRERPIITHYTPPQISVPDASPPGSK